MKKILPTLVLLSLPAVSMANTPTPKTLATEQETLKLCESFAERINKDFPASTAGLNIVRPYAVVPKIEMDTLDYQQTAAFSQVADRFGSDMGVVHIDSHKYAKDHYLVHQFLLKRSMIPLAANCIFYQPKNGVWLLNAFTWSSDPYFLDD